MNEIDRVDGVNPRTQVASLFSESIGQIAAGVESRELHADNSEGFVTDADIGGIVIGPQSDLMLHVIKERNLKTALGWYSIGGTPGVDFGVRHDTVMGRVYLGALQQLSTGAVTEYDVGNIIGSITGIDAEKVIQHLPSTEDAGERARALRRLFVEGQYGHIFVDTIGEAPNDSRVIALAVDRPEYDLNDEKMRIRFDYRSPDMTYDRAQVYILTQDGQPVIESIPKNPNLLISDVRGQLFIDVPMDVLKEHFEKAYGGVHGTFSVKVVLWTEKGESPTFILPDELPTFEIDTVTNPYIVTHEKLSVTNDPFENAVLSRTTFPLRQSDGAWYNALGSPWHNDAKNPAVNDNSDIPHFHAVDLNLTIGGNRDIGKPVLSVAKLKGKVISVDEHYGKVVMEYTDEDNIIDGKALTWYAVYLHMQNISVKVGDEVKGEGQIGEVGRKPNDSFDAHVDFKLTKTLRGDTIDLRKWLHDKVEYHQFEDFSIPKEKREFIWNEALKQLVNEDEQIVWVRYNTNNANDFEGYVAALNADGSIGESLEYDSATGKWFKLGNPEEIWNNESNSFPQNE